MRWNSDTCVCSRMWCRCSSARFVDELGVVGLLCRCSSANVDVPAHVFCRCSRFSPRCDVYFSCCFVRVCVLGCLYMHGGVLGHQINLHNSPPCSVVVMWRPPNPCGHFLPPHACPKYVVLTHYSLFLACFALVTCAFIPLHPSEPIPTLPSPFLPLYVCEYICVFFGKISRTYMAGNHTLLTYVCLFLSCFVAR